MSELGLTVALQTYVDKEETHAINKHGAKRDLNDVKAEALKEMAGKIRDQAQEENRKR
eukprot:gene40372-4823_t